MGGEIGRPAPANGLQQAGERKVSSLLEIFFFKKINK
jgi:hypothetical protein